MISPSPHRITCDAKLSAFIPEGQAIFKVTTGTDFGMPPLTEAVLAGLGPLPACRQLEPPHPLFSIRMEFFGWTTEKE